MFKEVSSKVDFADLERKVLSHWDKISLNKKYLERNQSSAKKFSFLDGPITANNPMGVHHAWGRSYKDLWQRFFNMKGFRQRFQNGFDEQGLWIEVEVEKELGLKSKKDIENLVPGNVFESIAKFVDLCKERVKKFSAVQTEQSKRLGYFMDWENSYHTSSDQNNYAIWHYLKTVHEKGWLYKGRDSVPWCPRCGTAISQHEILTEEYKEITHKALFVKYPVVAEDYSLLVWTTTPWTLPGNVAVAIDPKKDYAITKDNLVVMSSRIHALGLEKVKIIKGKDLIGKKYIGPFDQLERVKESLESFGHIVIDGRELVNEDEGTGLVHIAPGAGEEDFKLHKDQNLPLIELIDEEASYIDSLGEFSGKNAKKLPELIIDYLDRKDGGKFLFKVENYKHRYPTCWRCKTELVWRVVDEWYIAMDSPSRQDMGSKPKTYREMMKEVIKDINWLPKWGYDRELDWLNNMHDWLISKKRYWGLALPIWECTNCGSFDVFGSKEDLKKRAVEGWDKFEGISPHRPIIDLVKIKCSKCGETVSRIRDVGNVWLDAGIVSYSTLKYFEDKNYWQEWFPADFITESFPGQFKNWFYSLIAMSTALEAKAPFKTLLGHGQVRDEKGDEMHKSKGNAIWFDEAAEKMGVDVMRWIYLTTNPEHNVNFGYHVADEVRRRFFLIFWNVYVFFVTYANIDKWEPSATEKAELSDPLDRWIISELNRLIDSVNRKLENYDAATSSREIEKFVIDLSTWYVRRIRDRVGPTAKNGLSKVTTYQMLYTTLTALSKLLAPFTPFIAYEIYKNLTDEESVHLADYPGADKSAIDKDLILNMDQVRKLAEVGHSLRKEKGIKLRQPLAVFFYGKDIEKLPKELEDVLDAELNVKKIVYDKGKKPSFDFYITESLAAEGEARELVRKIQEVRKELGCKMDEFVSVELPDWPKEFEDYLKKETLAKNLTKGEKILVSKS
ncbi:MAG: isoleucine--tRNA ligase [Candidatus Woykebacteria bacterium]